MPLPASIINLLQGLGVMPQSQPPQAMTRVTRLPITFNPDPNPNVQGEYSPLTGSININPRNIPQTNPDFKSLNSVLTHEQVHAILSGPLGNTIPSMTSLKVLSYLLQNPKSKDAFQKDLESSNVPSGPLTLGDEAPAYASQGYNYGVPDATKKYADMMPAKTKATYQKLLDGTQGLNFPKVGDQAPELK